MKQVNLILGTMTFGESVFSPQVGEFIRAFLDAGYDELDTAYVYNEGNCERLLGEVLPVLDRPFKIATKVNPRISGKLDADAAYKQVNESLERMRLTVWTLCSCIFPIRPRRWSPFSPPWPICTTGASTGSSACPTSRPGCWPMSGTSATDTAG